MSDNISPEVLLVGCGPMSVDYVKVLKGLKKTFVVVGRGAESASRFESDTGVKPIIGGIESYIKTVEAIPSNVIVSVSVSELAKTTIQLLDAGVKKILLEKPGVTDADELQLLTDTAKKNKAAVFLAYNRRFYASTRKALEIIKEDGGVDSFNFEFTEWPHLVEDFEIKQNKKPEIVMKNWFLANSSHVADLAFYLGGQPKELCSFTKGSTYWHPSSSVFAGAGVSKSGALFSYQANWKAPGRWSVEILTNKHRLIFRPMEKLQIQKVGSVAINFVEGIDYTLDEQYKPGLYLETKAFLEEDYKEFCTLDLQEDAIKNYYLKIAGYLKNQN